MERIKFIAKSVSREQIAYFETLFAFLGVLGYFLPPNFLKIVLLASKFKKDWIVITPALYQQKETII